MAKIEIAKTGPARGADGKDRTITPEMLRSVAESYDPKLHEAPLVIGHPKTDDPAHGWVSEVEFSEEDGVLYVETRDVEAEFAEAVTEKRTFPKRSPSFYAPGSAANPVPGSWYLRHVGFLGAAAPGMKGLADVVSFREGDTEDAERVTVEFGEWEDKQLGRVLRSLREWIVSKWGIEEADKAMPSWSIDTIQEAALATSSTSFAEALVKALAPSAPVTEDPKNDDAKIEGEVSGEVTPSVELSPELAARAKELEERERALADKEKALVAREAKSDAESKRAEHLAFCEGIVSSGRALPLSADVLTAFMSRLDGVEEPDVISFGEGRAEHSSLAVFKELLSNLPITVDFAERSRSDHDSAEVDVAERAARIRKIQDDAASRGEHLTTVQAANRLES